MAVIEVYNCIYCNCADCCLFSAKQNLLIEKFMYKNVFIKKVYQNIHSKKLTLAQSQSFSTKNTNIYTLNTGILLRSIGLN